MSDACGSAGGKSAERSRSDQITVMVATLVCGLFELFVLIVVLPKFEKIFHDLLDGYYRPPLTTIFLDFRWAFFALAVFWMLAAIRTFQHGARACWSYVLLAATFGQAGCTVAALFLPLVVPFSVISS